MCQMPMSGNNVGPKSAVLVAVGLYWSYANKNYSNESNNNVLISLCQYNNDNETNQSLLGTKTILSLPHYQIMASIRSRLKSRWKMFLFLVGIWIVIIFPIPFLPAWGYPIDPNSLRTLTIITAIVSVPFVLLAIFINDGSSKARMPDF